MRNWIFEQFRILEAKEIGILRILQAMWNWIFEEFRILQSKVIGILRISAFCAQNTFRANKNFVKT